MKHLIICTAIVAMTIYFAIKVLTAECDRWVRTSFWSEADVAAVDACIAEGGKINARDKDGDTLLHLAARLTESPEIIDAMIGHRAEVNARNKDGDTPLHRAIEQNNNPEELCAKVGDGLK